MRVALAVTESLNKQGTSPPLRVVYLDVRTIAEGKGGSLKFSLYFLFNFSSILLEEERETGVAPFPSRPFASTR